MRCHTIISLVTVFSLSACMMGPDYKRPDIPPAEAWRLSPGTSESIANLPWWDLLRDQTLQGLIRTSLAENLDLRVAVATIEQYQAQFTIAQFVLAPSVSATGTGAYFHSTSNAIGIPGPRFRRHLHSVRPPIRGHGLRKRIQRSRREMGG